MENPLAQLGAYLTPPPVILSPDYDGLEYKWKMLTFRPARMSVSIELKVIVLIMFDCSLQE